MNTPAVSPGKPVIYPDDNGEPMAENTLQYEWIVTIKGNLDSVFRDDPMAFVAGDLLWYPVEGDNKTSQAPDTMVAFGRPKGYRGSYRQWEEGGVAPHVVFEILSPGNRAGKMVRKFEFYQEHGVEEYYVFDPETIELTGWQRNGDSLQEIDDIANWTSPRLKIRFELRPTELRIYRPDGQPFLTFDEIDRQHAELREAANLERQARESAQARAEQESQRAEQEKQRAELEKERSERLAAQLRALGVDPEA